MKGKETKVVVPMIIMVFTFVVLILGSAYAYFTADNRIFGTTNVNTEFASVSTSALKAKNNLKLNLSLVDMMKHDNNIIYYATLDGTPSTSENSEIIATATVNGNGKMDCNYTIKVNASGTNNMYTAFIDMNTKSINQLILNVAGTDYDLYNVTFPLTITGSLKNLDKDNSHDIKASFKIINRHDLDQSVLANKDVTLSFGIDSYTCSLVS